MAGMGMKEVAKLPENEICADCSSRGPDWTSINLGIFLCIECAGVHRNLGVHLSKVRSLELDTSCWDEEQIRFMLSIGNVRSRELYECFAPSFYFRPEESKSPIARENWIRAKYERKEFHKVESKVGLAACVFVMPEVIRLGWLEKQNGRDRWQRRYFILLGRLLNYYQSQSENTPKGSIDLSQVTIRIPENPSSPERRFEFHIVTSDRNYVMSAPTWEDMFNWIHAIRRARLFYEKVDSKEAKAIPVGKVRGKVLAREVGEGKSLRAAKLKKQGDTLKWWSDKWVVLTEDTIYWFKKKPEREEEEAEGGCRLHGCVALSADEKVGKSACFVLVAPERCHYFQCSSAADSDEWAESLRKICDSLTPRQEVDFRIVK